MIAPRERERMLRAHSIGPRMIAYLEESGIERLEDLVGADAEEMAMRINVAIGRKHLNKLGVQALRNLIDLANASVPRPSSAGKTGVGGFRCCD